MGLALATISGARKLCESARVMESLEKRLPGAACDGGRNVLTLQDGAGWADLTGFSWGLLWIEF